MEQPLFKCDENTGTYLGSYKNKDLFFRKDESISDPMLIVKKGDKQWDCFLMPMQQVKFRIKNGAFEKHSPFEECYKRCLEYFNIKYKDSNY